MATRPHSRVPWKMKPTIGQDGIAMRSRCMTWSRLIWLGLSLSGCAGNLPPSGLSSPDGRPCLIAQVTPDTLTMWKVVVPQANEGDVLVANWCLLEQADTAMEEIHRLAH